jgi:hypothetical protein
LKRRNDGINFVHKVPVEKVGVGGNWMSIKTKDIHDIIELTMGISTNGYPRLGRGVTVGDRVLPFTYYYYGFASSILA